MSINYGATLPLRQTCDRCRELKVQCKKAPDQDAAVDVDVMLRKTALQSPRIEPTDCAFYQARHPSGRHAAARGTHNGIKKRATTGRPFSAVPSLTTQGMGHSALDDIDWSWDENDLLTLGLTTGINASGVGMPSNYIAAQDSSTSQQDLAAHKPEAPHNTFADVLLQTDIEKRREEPTLDIAIIETITRDTSDLNIRISRMLYAWSDSKREDDRDLPSNDSLVEVSSSLLNMMDIMCSRARQSDVLRPTSPNSQQPPTSASSSVGPNVVALSTSATHQSESQFRPDIASALMILACHQRIVDLFTRICTAVSARQKSNDDVSSPVSSRNNGQTSDAFAYHGNATANLTNVQRFVTLQLMSYLLKKLDRGHAQFIDTIKAESNHPMLIAPASSSSITSQESPAGRIGGVSSRKRASISLFPEDEDANDVEIGLNSIRSTECVTEMSVRTHADLANQISRIKIALQGSDEI
ncbi:hypothetical protein F5Y16DRAFT_404229 [Xylariaceae sp. FL0255]|nr:hypothetical protein F5Y16DRAFT_404229 [Xylariaceae sp. FL0255]